MSQATTMRTRQRRILVITPQRETAVLELSRLLEPYGAVEIESSDAASVQGHRRGSAARIWYYWIDPMLTMLRLVPRLRRYDVIISYYHRNGYWLGLIASTIGRPRHARWIWIGFAPNPRLAGFRGLIKEEITAAAVSGMDRVVCNSRGLLATLPERYPKVAGRLAHARWGGDGWGSRNADTPSQSGDYIFCGGRTNRDFDLVLAAVTRLGLPTVLVMGASTRLSLPVPTYVEVRRDVPATDFQVLVDNARIVVLSLKRADISSGQVVLGRAMQAGKPLVVTATAGIDDYATDGHDALLTPPGDATAMADQIDRLWNNERLRTTLGANALETFHTKFNSKAFALEMFEALQPDQWPAT